MEEDDIVLIKVKRKTRENLKKKGIKGETYDTIINQLMRGAKSDATILAEKEREFERMQNKGRGD